jgi:hypothetical protein
MTGDCHVPFRGSPGLCPEFRRTQGSVTGSCGVFMRYGRLRPLGSCGRWAYTVVLPLGPGYRQGSFLPPPPDAPLPDRQVKGTLRVSLRDRCATPDMPVRSQDRQLSGSGRITEQALPAPGAAIAWGSPSLQDGQFRP